MKMYKNMKIKVSSLQLRRVDKGEGQYSIPRHNHLSIIAIFSIHLDCKDSYPSANRWGREGEGRGGGREGKR